MDELSTTFFALADPTRRGMLEQLRQGDATVSELAEPFDLSLPTISKHLKVLQHAGLVTQVRKAQFRLCHLETAPLAEVADWLATYRQLMGERYERLNAFLQDLQKRSAEGGSDE